MPQLDLFNFLISSFLSIVYLFLNGFLNFTSLCMFSPIKKLSSFFIGSKEGRQEYENAINLFI